MLKYDEKEMDEDEEVSEGAMQVLLDVQLLFKPVLLFYSIIL